MITFKNIGYLGRLGNQMFQFSSALGIAEKNNTEAKFPISNCTTFYGGGPIDVKTGQKMQVKCDLFDCFEIPPGYFSEGSLIRTERIYSEPDFRFNSDSFSLSPNTDLYGYFQTEKYFKHIREKILNCFKFRPEIEVSAENYWSENIKPKLGLNTPISLHVRRGDYTLYPNHHPVCSDEYYEKAMSNFEGNIKFLVFSDDIEWCKGQFIGEKFIFVDSGNPYSDLKIMTMCNHHIIANSSYSWWGAWLNKSYDKKVIAPSKWFGPELRKDVSDIYCEGWKII